MTAFSNYLCWTPAVAARTISTEAVAPSSSVFFATHTPLTIHRNAADGRRSTTLGATVNEGDVLHDFLSRPTANGVLLMPIIGQSGTGKSHLVRWVREKIEPAESRHVIYLEKARTSLRTVVDRLLADVGGDEIELLRSDVARMSEEVDQAGLERRLINRLSEAVSEADIRTGDARVLAGPGGLAVLFLDPHFRQHLLKPGKLIPRLAASLLADRRPGESDRPLEFAIDDLPLDIDNIRESSGRAQKLLSMLTTRPELPAVAVALLNECLPAAVTSAGNIGAGRLHRAVLEIRREFAKRGKELIVLIEDFALIQGVQRDLLDALIEVGERGGQRELAPVRTMMAVTSGYYRDHLPDTVRTRIRAATPYVYDLDVQFIADDDGSIGAEAFVGRYLNAARLGRELLDAARISESTQTPNACEDCKFRVECHGAFGVSSDGHGLYPFNRTALRRTIRSRLKDPDAFNPRTVVGEVVRTVMVDHAPSLERGEFPGELFRADFRCAEQDTPLASSVRHAIEEADPLGHERRAAFLEVWGDAPAHPINLDPVLHQAFSISLLDVEPVADLPAEQIPVERPARQPGSDATSSLPKSAVAMIGNVEDWASRGGVLNTATAQKLRKIISEAVIQRTSWVEPLMPEPAVGIVKRVWPPDSGIVSIDGAAAEGKARTGNPPIRFGRSPANSVFFQGLLRASEGHTDGSGSALRRLGEIAARHQAAFKSAVITHLRLGDDQLTFAVRASLLGAMLAGAASPGMDEAALLAVVVDEGQTWQRSDDSTRVVQWTNIWNSHRDHRTDLIRHIRSGLGVSRGDGAVRMIDAAHALPVLRQATITWTWPTPDVELPDAVKQAVRQFTTLTTVIDAQIDLLTTRIERIRGHFPRGTRSTDLLRAIDEALTAALQAGHAPDDHAATRAAIVEAQSWDWQTVNQTEQDLEKAAGASGGDKPTTAMIVAAVRDRGALAQIDEFLAACDQWVSNGLAQARQRSSVGDGASAAEQVKTLLARWAEIAGVAQS